MTHLRETQSQGSGPLGRVAVQGGGVKFIRLWFTDILGQLKSFAITKEELDNDLTQGMGFDGSSITGFDAIEGSDMIAMPDPDAPRSFYTARRSGRSR